MGQVYAWNQQDLDIYVPDWYYHYYNQTRYKEIIIRTNRNERNSIQLSRIERKEALGLK